MKKILVFLLIFLSVFAKRLDGICDYDEGESCMTTEDCSFCNISVNVNFTYIGTDVIVKTTVKNNEPAEIPLILSIRLGDETRVSKQMDIIANGIKETSVNIERTPENQTMIVELRDRDIGTAWNFQKFTIQGLQSESKADVLLPIVSIISFFSILYFGIRKFVKNPVRGPVAPVPMFVPPVEEVPDEEIIVLRKKKKYYYKKKTK